MNSKNSLHNPETMQDLNARARCLIFDDDYSDISEAKSVAIVSVTDAEYSEDGESSVSARFTEDLNLAAALWLAAPEKVKWAVLTMNEVADWGIKSVLFDLADLFTDPAALTRAVVEAWEAHNENR